MDKELKARMEKEASRREYAFAIFKTALCVAGVPIREMKVVETEHGDRLVKVALNGGAEYTANISADSIPTAMYGCMRQIPALREKG